MKEIKFYLKTKFLNKKYTPMESP